MPVSELDVDVGVFGVDVVVAVLVVVDVVEVVKPLLNGCNCLSFSSSGFFAVVTLFGFKWTVGGNGLGIGFSTGFVRPSPISCTLIKFKINYK